jgi:AsmA protein
MSKIMKRVLVALAAILAVAGVIVWLGPRLLGAHVRSRLEAGASAALGMQVQVGGRAALRFFPGLHVTLGDVHIRNHGAAVATADEVQLGIELNSLWHKDLVFESVRFKNAKITIARDKEGRFNIDRPPHPDSTSAAAAIAQVSMADSSLFYTDAQFGNDFSAQSCSVELRDLTLAPAAPADNILKSLSLTGRLTCAQMRTKNLAGTDVKTSIKGTDGILKFAPVALEILGGRGSGEVTANFTAAEPVYHVHALISKLQIADFSKTLTPEKIAEGALDFSATLTLRGTPKSGVMHTATGEASLQGRNLVLDIGDLDKEFSRYESTQSFNLIDVGAFLLAGPLGIAVTKGYDYSRILKKSEGTTTIRTLISQWKVERGVAAAQDVALATPQNRIAMKGELDLVNDTYDDVTVALVDPQGCPRVEQKIHGSFRKPQVEKPNVVTTITGPARKLLNKGKSLLGAKCTVFYVGAVAAPK